MTTALVWSAFSDLVPLSPFCTFTFQERTFGAAPWAAVGSQQYLLPFQPALNGPLLHTTRLSHLYGTDDLRPPWTNK